MTPERAMDERALDAAVLAIWTHTTHKTTTREAMRVGIAAYLSAIPAAPPLLNEWYWCGCVREARWTRCQRHATMDHDDEPQTRAIEEARAASSRTPNNQEEPDR